MSCLKGLGNVNGCSVLLNFLCWDKCSGIYDLFLLAFALFIFYRKLYLLNKFPTEEEVIQGDLMNRKVFSLPPFFPSVSGWKISHFVLFAIAGFLFPSCFYVALSVGIVWELMEFFMGKFTAQVKQTYTRDFVTPENATSDRTFNTSDSTNDTSDPNVQQKNQVEYSGVWWQGSFGDVVFNTGGFLFGMLLGFLFSKFRTGQDMSCFMGQCFS